MARDGWQHNCRQTPKKACPRLTTGNGGWALRQGRKSNRGKPANRRVAYRETRRQARRCGYPGRPRRREGRTLRGTLSPLSHPTTNHHLEKFLPQRSRRRSRAGGREHLCRHWDGPYKSMAALGESLSCRVLPLLLLRHWAGRCLGRTPSRTPSPARGWLRSRTQGLPQVSWDLGVYFRRCSADEAECLTVGVD